MEAHNRFLRQLDILPPEKLAFPITVIGAGAIGSAAVITLAKMGCTNLTVWDDDILTEHNLPNQMCACDALGYAKVEALATLVITLTGTSITARNERYRGQRLAGVVIAAVDSMSARQEIWKRVRLNGAVPLLIDARMGAEFARLYAIHPTRADEIAFYEENLYRAEDAERLPCSARAIIYCPTIIGGLIALQVKEHALGRPLRREILFDLPGWSLLAHRFL